MTTADTYNKKPGAHPMSKVAFSVIVSAITVVFCFVTTVYASSAEIEEAVTLLKQMHADQCQQQQLRGQVMLAHRNHDEETLKELWPQIEAISKRLKPLEDKLKALKANFKQNPDDQSAFETALLREAECG